MVHFFSFLLVMLIGAAGILTIYLIIDFFEYLKKYQIYIWKDICFERLFGVERDDFFFYPVNPTKFVPFLLENDDDPGGDTVAEYKKRIKCAGIGLIGLILFNILVRIFI